VSQSVITFSSLHFLCEQRYSSETYHNYSSPGPRDIDDIMTAVTKSLR